MLQRLFFAAFVFLTLTGPALSHSRLSPWAVLDTERVEALARGLRALQPALTPARSTELSALLHEYSPAPWTSAAILMQESSLKDTHVFKTGYDTGKRKVVRTLFDAGIAQVNVNTAVHHGCNLEGLAGHDTREAIRCHSRVLRAKLDACRQLGVDAWSCYHSATPVFRLKYVADVKRWQRVLDAHRPSSATRSNNAVKPPPVKKPTPRRKAR